MLDTTHYSFSHKCNDLDSSENIKKLKEICEADARTFSYGVLQAIAQFVKKHND